MKSNIPLKDFKCENCGAQYDPTKLMNEQFNLHLHKPGQFILLCFDCIDSNNQKVR